MATPKVKKRAKKRVKFPVETRRERQAKTYLKKYGRRGYVLMGRKGGGPGSPGSFTSESARKAALVGWEKRRARQAEQLKQEEA